MACNTFSFITLSVQRLRNVCHRQTLFSWLGCAKSDDIALQEAHCTSEKEFKEWVKQENKDNNNKQNYLVKSSPGTTRSSGVAILYKPHSVVKKVQRDNNGRFFVTTFCHEEVEYSFQVLAESKAFWRRLFCFSFTCN